MRELEEQVLGVMLWVMLEIRMVPVVVVDIIVISGGRLKKLVVPVLPVTSILPRH